MSKKTRPPRNAASALPPLPDPYFRSGRRLRLDAPIGRHGVALVGTGAHLWFPDLGTAVRVLGWGWLRYFLSDVPGGRDPHVVRAAAARRIAAPQPPFTQFRLIDDAGETIGPTVIEPWLEPMPARWLRLPPWHLALVLMPGAPVPLTGKLRGGGGTYRRPGTTPERRMATLVLSEEGEVAPRPSRRLWTLPSVWDDALRSDHRNRSWKRHRRTRYKVRRDHATEVGVRA